MRAWSCTGYLALLAFGCSNDDSATFEAIEGDSGLGGGASGATTAGGRAGKTGAGGGKSDGGAGGGESDGGAGGGESDGGEASAGKAHGGQAGAGGTPVMVAACAGLAEPGEFQEITPPLVKAGIGTATADNQTKGGTFALAVDPINQGTVYAGTVFQGVWKSTDCGASWKLIATGKNAAEVNGGMNWTLVIDPQNANVVYTNSGRGTNGLFKSSDAGVSWTETWSPQSQPELSKSFTYNFVNVMAIDPHDHLHLLLTFHEACLAPHPDTCIAESMNGGSTWRLIDGDPTWDGTEGQVIFFLDDSSTWLWGSQANGFWRSGDSGESWEAIAGMTTTHLEGSQIVRTKGGAFFVAGGDGIWTSPDGQVATWKLVPDTGPIAGGLVTDGRTMYASTCYFGDFCNPRYLYSPEADGQTWTALTSPKMSQGGNLGYDKAHKLLYSSNLDAGLWRVVVP